MPDTEQVRSCETCIFYHPEKPRVCGVFPRMPEDERTRLEHCCAWIGGAATEEEQR